MTTIAAAAATSRQLKPPIASRAASAARIAKPMIQGERLPRNSLNAWPIVRTSAPYRAAIASAYLAGSLAGGPFAAIPRASWGTGLHLGDGGPGGVFENL